MSMRDFQKEAVDCLCKCEPTLVVAPTGLGKTRAGLQPFVSNLKKGGVLGTRLLYSLPLRALSHDVRKELEGLSPIVRATVHHGEEPESQFFSERAVITTVDQYFAAFAGAPLSWASHLSHAAAGAALMNYSVFDEVHLLSPQAGLRLLFAILRLRQRWGLLSCVMTATMPENAKRFFQQFCGLKLVEATSQDVQERDRWRSVKLQPLGERPKKRGAKKDFQWREETPEDIAKLVKEHWERWERLEVDGPRKIIVFVNTVDRAITVYRNIRDALPNAVLAHSRFTKEDRRQVEFKVHSYFGKDAVRDEAILVTTQVAEAGLNISAPLVITELCPMDSLIQRAGRCQRFKAPDGYTMRGRVLVVKPAGNDKWFLPYEKDPAERTREALESHNPEQGVTLDWKREQDLVNEALDEIYRRYLQLVHREVEARGVDNEQR